MMLTYEKLCNNDVHTCYNKIIKLQFFKNILV